MRAMWFNTNKKNGHQKTTADKHKTPNGTALSNKLDHKYSKRISHLFTHAQRLGESGEWFLSVTFSLGKSQSYKYTYTALLNACRTTTGSMHDKQSSSRAPPNTSVDGISPAAETTADTHYDCLAATLYCLTSPGHWGNYALNYALKRPLWGEHFWKRWFYEKHTPGNVHCTLRFTTNKLRTHLC